jgi:hypothetical protein
MKPLALLRTPLSVMNNLRENSVGLFDTRSSNPLEWKKLGVIKDPLWKGAWAGGVPEVRPACAARRVHG